MKLGLDIQSQAEVKAQKLKNPIWPPDGHFESDIAENQQAHSHTHMLFVSEVWTWYSKPNWSWRPENE